MFVKIIIVQKSKQSLSWYSCKCIVWLKRSVMDVMPVCRILQRTVEALPPVDGAARNRAWLLSDWWGTVVSKFDISMVGVTKIPISFGFQRSRTGLSWNPVIQRHVMYLCKTKIKQCSDTWHSLFVLGWLQFVFMKSINNIPWSIIQHFFKKLQFFFYFSFLVFNISVFWFKENQL